MSKTVIVKYKHAGDEFEILVNSDMAYEYITGKRSDPLGVLEAEDIFRDANKGEKASDEKLKKAFGTTEVAKIADIMLKKGDVPITTEQRARLADEKRKQIIETIAKNSIDPRTNAPNPPLRVENAMKEARISVDPFKSVAEQVEIVVDKLRPILPLKFTTVKIEVIVPPESANRSFSILKQYGMKSDEWQGNGSLKAVLEFPAGLQGEFFDKINKLTQGKVLTKILQ
jgi:ribosome maturation protein SDO1